MVTTALRTFSRRVVLPLLGVGVLLAACADSQKPDELSEALALLRSADAASRYEAVVRLGTLAPSQGRRDGLTAAVRDSDDAVRLLAAVVIVGDGSTEPAAPSMRPASPTPNPLPERAVHGSPADELVYSDPWFAGTLLPGALKAAQDGDERVRALGIRALNTLKPEGARGAKDGGLGR